MKKKFFPWRLFWKFFVSLFLLLVAVGLGSAYLSPQWIGSSFNSDKAIVFFLRLILVCSVTALIFAYRFALPLRRVILKALRMANKQLFFQISGREVDEESLFESEPGEYFELEQALDQIRKKMKKRREQLAHEREEAQAIMTSIGDGVVNISPDLRLLYYNSGFAAHFLTQAQVQMSAEQPLMLTQVLRDPSILELFDSAVKEGRGGNIQRQMSTLVTGGLRYFSATINPLRDPKTREIYGALGVFHDITELKRAEQIRIEFVENASHELRTPLTTVKGYLETFKEDFYAGKNEQASFFLNTISKNVDRLTELVSDLLTISALENGIAPELDSISADQVTGKVMERFSRLATEKEVRISFRVEGFTHFRGDPSKVQQVLENLLGNAIKYGKPGGLVEIRWQKLDETSGGGPQICLSVKDNGQGISAEHLPRLFERFYRVDKARSREVGGTGLGLAIVKHILQNHGGHVEVTSEVGVGTEFRCLFPDKNA